MDFNTVNNPETPIVFIYKASVCRCCSSFLYFWTGSVPMYHLLNLDLLFTGRSYKPKQATINKARCNFFLPLTRCSSLRSRSIGSFAMPLSSQTRWHMCSSKNSETNGFRDLLWVCHGYWFSKTSVYQDKDHYVYGE